MNLLQTALPRRYQRALLFVVLWLFAGLLSSLHWELFYFGRNPYSWWELFRVKVALWYVWGAITPVILWLGWRVRFERTTVLKHLAILIPISVVTTGLFMVLYTAVLIVNAQDVASLQQASFGPMFDWVIGVHSSWYFLAFWATIGVENAIGYYRRYHEREIVASQLETQLVEAQLEAVRSRLQPHFLFNTLHSIHALMQQGDLQAASRMLGALSDLLRRALDHVQKREVTLREEIEFLRRYLDIELVRFSDRLTVTWAVDQETEGAFVPSFVLQPLVENAIRHGIESRPGPGHIDVIARREADMTCLEIRDNGTGLATQDDAKIVQGHGLGDLRARLDALYAGRYSLNLISANGCGTCATLRLPYVVHTGVRENG